MKSMLFLDVTSSLEENYLKFEAVLYEKGFAVERYEYIKKLIQYKLLHQDSNINKT